MSSRMLECKTNSLERFRYEINIAFSLNSYIYFWRSLHFFCWLDLLLFLFPRKRLTWFFTSPVAVVSSRFPRYLLSLIFLYYSTLLICVTWCINMNEWIFSAESDYTLLLRNQKVAFLADALVPRTFRASYSIAFVAPLTFKKNRKSKIK